MATDVGVDGSVDGGGKVVGEMVMVRGDLDVLEWFVGGRLEETALAV